MEKVYGWPLQDVIGFNAKKFCASEGRENWENLAWNITEIITANDQWNGVVLEQNKTGETFPVLIKIVRVKAEGEFIRWKTAGMRKTTLQEPPPN